MTKLEKIVADLYELRDARQEVYDNRSETWQESEKGEAWNASLDSLQCAIDALEEIEL